MAGKEFNLLHEPWIRVMREDCRVEEVSLSETLLHAHEYRRLAGELPTQDAAILRLLLAVLHAVFERVNADGEDAEIETADEAIARWAELWKNGCFPEAPLSAYFTEQQENFWLFHPTRPFWQIPIARNGTEYDASKLNGSLSESSNKIRLFPERTGLEKKMLSFSEAARWLIYINAYDDTSAKPTKEGKVEANGKLPSPGAGWLGKIGFVCVSGSTLFETLMLNFVLLDNNEEPWTSCVPTWELKIPRCKERTEIPIPHDQAALLTVQSRRLFLRRDESCVNGYYLIGGDFFDKENAFSEQMTVWNLKKDAKGTVIGYQPCRHSKARQMWRDFPSYIPADNNLPIPGVINWNIYLQKNDILPATRVIQLEISSVQYGDKDFFMADIFSDSLSLHFSLLSDLGAVYRRRITEMIARCDQIARNIGQLASDLFLASGGDAEKRDKPIDAAKEQYYFAIDAPFRKWLSSLDVSDTAEVRQDRVTSWCREADAIAYELAERIVQSAGQPAFIGKVVAVSKDNKKYYSSSLAMQWFKGKMKNLNRM